MTKVIKGIFEYEIHITEESYELKASPKVEDELASLIVVNMLASYAKDNVSKSLENTKGKQKTMFKERLGKINSTKQVLLAMGDDYVRELSLLEQEVEKEESIMGLEDIAKLNNK